MKKAKILLTAIGVFAIVGGALAFKANRGAVVFCAQIPAAAGFCDDPLENFTTTAFAATILRRYCTLNPNAPCLTLVGLAPRE